LRIDTIHAFSQWLLSAFPAEAGLLPGVKAMEDRERDDLAREVLSELLLDAERSNDVATLRALELLSIRMGPLAVPGWLLRCAKAREAWEAPAGWQPPMRPGVLRLLGLSSEASSEDLLDLCSDGVFDTDALECCLSAYSQWNGKKGQEGRAVIRAWLEAGPQERLEQLPALHAVLFTQKDTVKDVASLSKFEEHFESAAESVLACGFAVREHRAMLELADFLAPALEVGRKFSFAWDDAKARAGFIDFDDQIRQAAALLGRSELADWIRYKLDRRFDHILVDEAQDTNAAQWDIFFALIDDFFSGEGAHGDKLRTAFVVGDYKQAIFRFQGTSPENFAKAKERVRQQMLAVAENALALRDNRTARQLQDLDLGKSYRTAHEILDFVDRAIGELGQDGLGLDKPAEPHVGQDRPGQVVFWRVLGGASEDESDPAETADEGEEGWLSRSDRKLADTIARQVRDWMDHGFPLVKEKDGQTLRRAAPGDVMVLVRKRKELAGLIVARLYARGVPVAGVDRLRLGAPLAVRDLMAALRFAAQPHDDLN
ncbi:MAG: UvrD-helicase domain-containing protein, partial [Sphingomonadaceae bacterium]|nr:UvrD-helicase domain-containing protein [Sphingomonadaceae bacterium]